MSFNFIALHDLIDHILEFLRVPESECIYYIVIELVLAVENKKKLIILLRPFACKNLVL